jgi:23S rRNA (cytosine1962-C5)-methyltransferase
MPKAPAPENLLTVKVSPRGATRLKSGHVWVYRSDIVSAEGVEPGSLIRVTDYRGKPLGSALYSSSSQIAIRMISNDQVPSLPTLLRQRIAAAISYREPLVTDTAAYRVVFSEADFLPGLIVDRYGDIVSLQILTQAMDANLSRETVISELSQQLHPVSIIERVDARVRELESLPPRASGLLQGSKTATTFAMNGVQFQYDALEGQKTGAFPRRLLLSRRLRPPPRSPLLAGHRRRQFAAGPRSRRPERCPEPAASERKRNRMDRR